MGDFDSPTVVKPHFDEVMLDSVELTGSGPATFDLVWAPESTFPPFSVPLAVNISVMLVRVERGRCAQCHLRRVRFQLQANTGAESDAVCAKCAGMRA